MGDEADGFLKSERESLVLGRRERCCLNEEKDVFEWREEVVKFLSVFGFGCFQDVIWDVKGKTRGQEHMIH